MLASSLKANTAPVVDLLTYCVAPRMTVMARTARNSSGNSRSTTVFLSKSAVTMKKRVTLMDPPASLDAAADRYRCVEGIGYDRFDSPVGPITIVGSPQGVHEIFLGSEAEAIGPMRSPTAYCSLSHSPEEPVIAETRQQLQEYFSGDRKTFSLPLAPLTGTKFQRSVWEALNKIPYGKTISYGEQASSMGLPLGSARAVGGANGKNPLPIVVPCHRVIGKSGALTGFGSGLDKKEILLAMESK